MQETRNLRNASMIVDLIHVAVGVLVVVLAVVSFLNPEDHLLMFPAIFFLAGVLNFINGIYKIRLNKRKKNKKAAGVINLFLGGLLFALTVISAVSIWWR